MAASLFARFVGLAMLLQLCSTAQNVQKESLESLSMKEQFGAWMNDYGKKYDTEKEHDERLAIFSQNAKMVYEHNAGKHSYTMKLNEFADLTFEEFSQLMLMDPQDCSATNTPKVDVARHSANTEPPSSMDWRSKGAITHVKNQGECGSCWTFSTTGCLESHHFLKTGQLISLSEQQLVDCAQAFNNHGCGGGLPSQAFEYIRYNGGLESEADYPYKAHNEKCHFNASEVAATVSDAVNITQGDEDGIYNAVGTVGPVSIAFHVSAGFQMYHKGVYSSFFCPKSFNHVNHAVLAVGYNTTDEGEPYWIVKNSWGASWGIDGYFWIVRGKNMCGLADCASYPVV